MEFSKGWRLRPILSSVILLLALPLWIGCASAQQPGVERARLTDTPTQGPVSSPVPMETRRIVEPATATPQPTAMVVSPALPPPTAVEVSPTPPPATPIPTEAARPTPTAPPVATLPATAEGPNQESSDLPRGTQEAPPPRSSVQQFSPQPLPLHPFRPAAGRARVVAIDPGHGGPEVGAGGAGLAEKNVNLSIALKLRKLLEQDGMTVVMTRDRDSRANAPAEGQAPETGSSTRQDLQARIDLANRSQADVLVSIHNNGSGDPGQSGTEVWYDGKRPFGTFNAVLAEDVLASLVETIRGVGYPTADRGVKEDSQYRIFQNRAFPLFLLGPPRTGSSTTRAAQMPAVLGETLFLSNPAEAWQLTREDMISAIAAGYRQGLLRYFQRIESGVLAMPAEGLPSEKPNYYQLTPNPSAGG
ncbi:MAG: N-acetylmuramoyl-L-alanine amidase [Chloroflexi bacterium]|nr:N-acetylmuramoyl-L-alanine amidase [Chloroflexota bacterium]